MGIAATVALGTPAAFAQGDVGALPLYDIAKTCHDQASYAFAATLGQVDLDHENQVCATRERASRDLAAAAWSKAAIMARTDCMALAEGHYTRLFTCLSDTRERR